MKKNFLGVVALVMVFGGLGFWSHEQELERAEHELHEFVSWLGVYGFDHARKLCGDETPRGFYKYTYACKYRPVRVDRAYDNAIWMADRIIVIQYRDRVSALSNDALNQGVVIGLGPITQLFVNRLY